VLKVKVDKTLVASITLHVLVIGWGLVSFSTEAKSLDQDENPLMLSVNLKGQVFLNDSEIALNDLVPKLKAITGARGSLDERIFVRGDKKVDYGTVMKVMGLLSAAGFRRVALVTEVDQG
jgi:biopolymer transport protein TolR